MNTLQRAWLSLGAQVGIRQLAKRRKVIEVDGIELCLVHNGILVEGDDQCFWNTSPHDFITDGECIGTPLYRKAN